jgi:hypothetical protein
MLRWYNKTRLDLKYPFVNLNNPARGGVVTLMLLVRRLAYESIWKVENDSEVDCFP